MFPKPFDYHVPRSLDEALTLVERFGDEARVLAGGQSLVPLMKLRFIDPAHVIDLNRIPELGGIEERGSEIRCGAMVRHADIERSTLLGRRIPLLHEAARDIADVQVRNRGTLGGALCQADPAGDWAVAALALKARLRCLSRRGERTIEASGFFQDTYTPALEPGEILTDVFLPVPPPESAGIYIKMQRRAGDFAIASVALQLAADGKGRCESVGLALGGVSATPLAPAGIAEFLVGRVLCEAVIDEAAAMLPEQLDPMEDVRGSADYKRKIAKVAFGRALTRAMTQVRERTLQQR